MERRFRISAVGRIRPGAAHEAVKSVVVAKLTAKGLKAGDLHWRWIPSPNGAQLYGQFTTVIPAAQLDDAWNISASRAFSDAGYGDLVWKVTRVEPDGERTAGSIPQGHIRQEMDAHDSKAAGSSQLPPEPFGCDRFWEWFEGLED